MIPRGTTHSFELAEGEEQFWICFRTPGEIETPNRYRNRYGQLLEHSPYSQRDLPPEELETFDEQGEYPVTDARARRLSELHARPPSVRRRRLGRLRLAVHVQRGRLRAAGRPFHLPPPAHQTFQGPNFVICTFAPRMLDWDPQAVVLPYRHHSNIQSEEVMFYAAGDYAARKGVDIGSITLHPSGLPHGPQPGAVEKSIGKKSTDELAVMWDTFRPLRLSTLWSEVDKPEYAYSWNPDRSGEVPRPGRQAGVGHRGHRAVGLGLRAGLPRPRVLSGKFPFGPLRFARGREVCLPSATRG